MVTMLLATATATYLAGNLSLTALFLRSLARREQLFVAADHARLLAAVA